MKDVFLIYDGCCFYEIVTLSYFMRYAGCELVFCAPEKSPCAPWRALRFSRIFPLRS